MTEARLIVENFVDSMTHLMELLIKETSILNDKDFDGLESIQSRKLHLSRVYEDAQKRLQEQRDSVNCLNEEEREDLRKLYKKFRGVLSENMIVLRGSHDATENVIKIVIDAVKKERGIQPIPHQLSKLGRRDIKLTLTPSFLRVQFAAK